MRPASVLPWLSCSVFLLAPDGVGQLGGGPVQEAYVKASNTETIDDFGYSVAISGDTMVIAANAEGSSATGVNGDQGNNGEPYSGAAYVFVRTGAGWTQQAYLKASNTQDQDDFGYSVAISGDTIVVGAQREDGAATGVNGDDSIDGSNVSGAAYVFVRTGTTWSQQAYLKASNTGQGDVFGRAVAISGDTIAVAAISEKSAAAGVNGDQGDNSLPGAGAVYVFVRDGTTWTQQAYLKASNPGYSDYFGWSLALSGDTLVAGAISEDSAATGVNGDQFDNSAEDSGAAYVFARSGTTWTQQAYLKASNTGALDSFGGTVAVSGDTVVVGANEEDSNAKGVNGDQLHNFAGNAGAAYVFVRNGATWSQQAYLKASNTQVIDAFGTAVSISGDTVLVGATGEDSRATGVNGNQADDSVLNSGAAYLFVRNGTTWSQKAYLKASNTSEWYLFGGALAVSGDRAVVSSTSESSNATGVNGDQDNDDAPASGAAYVFDLDLDAWTDLGAALAGASGAPLLEGTGPLSAASANELGLSSAKPSSAATLVFGLTQLGAPFKGGTLVPSPLLLLPLQTDSLGELSLPFTWPAGVPSGTPLYFQFWVSDPAATSGFSASNGLQGLSS